MATFLETSDADSSSLTTYSLAPGETFKGALTAGDGDWIAITVEEGRTYTIAMTGVGALADGVGDTFLSLVDDAGVEIAASNDDGPGLFSQITFTATQSGVYYINAQAVDPAATGDYMVSVATGIKASLDGEMIAGVLLRTDLSWSATTATNATITWAARDTMAAAASLDASGEVAPYYQLSADQITAVTDALASFADVAGLTFTRNGGTGYSDSATMLFSAYTSSTDAAAAYASMPGTTADGDPAGDVRINNYGSSTTVVTPGTYEYLTILHEIGHALGLSHPGDYNASPDVDLTYEANALFVEDTRQYTVMSYFSADNSTPGFTGLPDGLLLNDILAVQQLYGVNATTRSGNTIYGFNTTETGTIYDFTANSDPVLSIWDGGGTDTIDVSGFAQDQVVDLREGHFSSIGGMINNVSVAYNAVIENAIGGSGDDTLIGNAVANELTGGAGNDRLDGKAGADTMVGETGDDTYVVDDAGDVVTEASAEGTDTVEFLGANGDSCTLVANVENLTLIGTANTDAVGNSDDNTITGNAGNNTLDGGGTTDTDTLAGGAGNDIYLVADLLDTVVEAADAGDDTVKFTGANGDTYVMTANVEHLELLGTANANGTGNSGANTILGNSGDNTIDGGAGIDTMTGSTGDDTYVVDDVADVVVEVAAEGTDTINYNGIAGVTYVMADNVENLVMQGTLDLQATGNADDNDMTGNTGNNAIDGGAGTDTMTGLTGDDTYYADDVTDTIVEATGEGTDTVVYSGTTGTFTLAADVENLTLTGSANTNGTGNVGNNVLRGNTGKNVLTGGDGDDTYYIDAGDTIVELTGEGTDTVVYGGFDGETYVLATDLENVTLTGKGATNILGNAADNVLTGNAGSNVIDGGAGADTMDGAGGDDTYYVDATDSVSEASGNGFDTVNFTGASGDSFTLGANVEKLVLGGSADTDGVGNASDNIFVGNTAANDFTGAAGDDIYVLGRGDTATEISGEGTDTVRYQGVSGETYILGGNIENLELLGNANFNGTGNGDDNIITGNGGNNTLDGNGGVDTLIGGLGNDTYIVDATTDVVTEDADAGVDTISFSAATGAYVLGANVENLTLTGATNIGGTGNTDDNVLTGNSGDNTLTGLAGDDTLDGGAGTDTLVGGIGDDTYIVDVAADVVSEAASAGTDLVKFNGGAGDTYVLGANIENITIIGTAAANATGNTASNILTGNAAANVLNGGTGIDTMIGGAGNDTYVLDVLTDIVVENAGGGTDTINYNGTAGGYTLGDYIENLVLGGTANLNGTGNTLDNTITGNAGVNILDGGLGNDTLVGGAGNDTYLVDSSLDVITENSAEGTDLVNFTGVDGALYTLSANVENIVLMGTTHTRAMGNASNNLMTGNAGNNVLNGGAGNDTMVGQAGNDTYVVDSLTDVVTELVGGGTDTVQYSGAAATTYTLAANVENLKLVGAAANNGTGNALANTITGNAAANTIDGGAGTDTLIGQGGDDVYKVDAVTDLVIELANEGTDTVQFTATTGTFVLGANIENLTLVAGATYVTNGTGNALNNTIIGNGNANILDGGLGDDTLTGGAGNDTYIVDSVLDIINENSAEGTDTVQFKGTTGTYTLAANFENLTLLGTANINGTGNTAVNVITGNAGNNVLDGGAGVDTLIGGAGDDTYKVDQLTEVITEAVGAGTDTVIYSGTTGTYTLGANLENLVLAGTSNTNGTGNILNNRITGNSGNNILDGGIGIDTLVGGAGDDTYYVDVLTDVVVEDDVSGTDTVIFNATAGVFTLGNNIENLTLAGTAALSGNGNILANTITGNAGANTIDGKAGADTMIGLGGNDIYLVDNVGDVVTEGAGAGTDLVRFTAASGTYVLGANVENLTLMGTTDINGTGNALANTITGNTGNNILDGDAGIDTMVGGTGNDTYYIDVIADVVTEAAAAGTDTVMFGGTTGTYTLAANVENLTLTGSAAINGTGNLLNNTITGNSGANILDGGLGNDTMIGGDGNDTYRVDSITEVVTELANQGTDTIIFNGTAGRLTLSANVENLTLGGTALINGSGNDLDNTITGNSAKNLINGGLGDDFIFGKGGLDVLTGGGGADVFVIDTALSTTLNMDTITDFNVLDDTVRLENAIFTALSVTGTLASTAFRANLTGLAQSAGDRIIYETDTGRVMYDADGSGAGASVQILQLQAGLSLTYDNFDIV